MYGVIVRHREPPDPVFVWPTVCTNRSSPLSVATRYARAVPELDSKIWARYYGFRRSKNLSAGAKLMKRHQSNELVYNPVTLAHVYPVRRGGGVDAEQPRYIP